MNQKKQRKVRLEQGTKETKITFTDLIKLNKNYILQTYLFSPKVNCRFECSKSMKRILLEFFFKTMTF